MDCQDARCSLGEIEDRIVPIQYSNNTLVVQGALQTETLFLDDQPLSAVGGVLDLPADSTIGGAPLDALPFTGDILELPTLTTLDGFLLWNTNYFYFFNTSQDTASGNYLIGSTYPSFPWSPGVPTNNIRFPFFAPQDCILTSLLFSFAVSSPGTSTITNATAYLEVVDLLGNVSYTGFSATIPSCPVGSKYYAETTFQYPLPKGHSAGVRYTYSGSASVFIGICQFATLGYRFVPPT